MMRSFALIEGGQATMLHVRQDGDVTVFARDRESAIRFRIVMHADGDTTWRMLSRVMDGLVRAEDRLMRIERLVERVKTGWRPVPGEIDPEIYTGHGRESRNIGDRIDEAARQTSQVYVIFSGDPRFDKPAASYLEARLIDTAADLAIPLANGIRPFGIDGLNRSADLEQLVAQTLFLLAVAGFRRFEQARQPEAGRPVRVTATGDLHDVLVIEPEAMTIPADAVRHRLICRDLRAVGFAIGNRFLVLPDADYCYEAKSAHSRDDDQRFQAMVITVSR